MKSDKDLLFKIDRSIVNGIESDFDGIPPNFCMALIGKPGSGKTTLLKYFFKEERLLCKRFNKVYIISPSFQEYKNCFLLPSENFTAELDFSWINNKISKENKLATKEKKKNIVFIFDDVVTHLRSQKAKTEFSSFIFNRRHLIENGTISIIVTSQKYKTIPPEIRITLNVILLFPISEIEISQIEQEHVTYSKNFKEALSITFTGLDKFLFFRIDNSTYYNNFNKIIIN